MPVDRSMADCLVILGVEKPKLSGKTQAEVDAKLDEWKAGPLKEAYKLQAHQTHPDKNPDDPEAGAKFTALVEAFEQLQKFRVRLKKPEKVCPSGHERQPETAKYCHECGYCFEEEPVVAMLRGHGLTDQTISTLREGGGLDRIKGMSPFSTEFHNEIHRLKLRQQVERFRDRW